MDIKHLQSCFEMPSVYHMFVMREILARLGG
jgi:hypothetical protein